jgi:hypothetical protein
MKLIIVFVGKSDIGWYLCNIMYNALKFVTKAQPHTSKRKV